MGVSDCIVDPALLQSEFQVSHLLPGNTILDSTVGVPADQGGSARGDRVAYTALSSQTISVYEADVSATPNPHVVATSGARVIGFRPDDAAILYSRAGQVFESMLDGTAHNSSGGAFGWYDSTGNIVVLKQFLPSGGTPPSYTALAVSVRGSFGHHPAIGHPCACDALLRRERGRTRRRHHRGGANHRFCAEQRTAGARQCAGTR